MEVMIAFMWVLIGVICALIADSKNRNALGWFFGGALFGVFALIAVAVLPKTEKTD